MGTTAIGSRRRRHERDNDQHDPVAPGGVGGDRDRRGRRGDILGALILQYGLGLQPCPLCLEQRYAYYFAIPLPLTVLVGDQVGASRKVLVAALVAIALGMLWNASLGVYHSGIGWKWWAGPQECTGALGDLGSTGGLLNKLESITLVRCDEAAWRFLGLSLAGYNALISLALAC